MLGYFILMCPVIELQPSLLCTIDTNKKREYAQRICEIEHDVFTSLVLSGYGRMAC